MTDADAQAGRPLYLRECAACHGERGDGAGPAAEFLSPRPRDFTARVFKVRTTDSGIPPRTEDVLRTIERGFPGTAMPPFEFLTEPERRQVAAQVLALAGLLHNAEPPRLPVPASPPPTTRESVAHGKQLYRDAECFSCHGKSGKGDGPSAATLRDVDDRPIPARNLTGGLFRGGADRVDLYYRISGGMDGSPMPEFGSSIDEGDRWALVDYVLSLAAGPRRPPQGDRAALEIAERGGCRGCHVLGDGRGGALGPDLRVAGQKLRAEWLEAFLRHPRRNGQIYPSSTYPMPDMRLADDEARLLTDYVLRLGKRRRSAAAPADLGALPAPAIERGQALFAARCAACHALGGSPAGGGSSPGPDLTQAAARLDFAWAKGWIREHGKAVAGSDAPTDADLEDVRAFVWKSSGAAVASAAAGG
ncbi:MAG: c-type cytochrome [Deltaproteobacteria bacterium]|nr:c-type cytochrome [Deltaproteobacteria bacterium]